MCQQRRCKSIAEQATIEVQKNEIYHRSRFPKKSRIPSLISLFQINSLAAQISFLPRRLVNLLFGLVRHSEHRRRAAQALYLLDDLGRDAAQHLFHFRVRTQYLLLRKPRGWIQISKSQQPYFQEVEKQQKGMMKIIMWICELFRIFSWDVGIMLSIAYWVKFILEILLNFHF